MNIKPWLDECCTIGDGYRSGIAVLWKSFDKWLDRQPNAQEFMNHGMWPLRMDLREALLKYGFRRKGYASAKWFEGVKVRDT